jgi:hypothetical protein
MAVLVLGAEIQTARIPELPPKSLDLSLADLIPYYVSSENKTRKITVQQFMDFLLSGGVTTAHPPVTWGAELIYIVPDGVAPGTIDANIPSLAGMDFNLERAGFPMIALLEDESNIDVAEFEILDGGGFRLLQDGDELHEKERFKLTVFSLIGGGPSTTINTTAFIRGKKVVTTNTTLDVVNDLNKVIQLRADTSQVTITLPSVADMPENSLIIVESSINNSKQNAVTTSGGQFIYMRNQGRNTLWIAPGESLWLFRDSDGLYVLNDFYINYRDMGIPQPKYKVDINELTCKGQTVLRADYPRLWEYVQTLGFSLVSDATWLSGVDKGLFSTGDGSTTFRLPDLMNMFLRGLKSDSGTDPERSLNKAGGYQADMNKKHGHNIKSTNTNNSSNDLADVVRGSAAGTVSTRGQADDAGADNKTIGASGGIESRPVNIGVLWCIKC